MARKKKAAKKASPKYAILAIIVAVGIAVVAASFSSESTESEPKTHSLDPSKGSPILGSEDAPVTIIEFGDYQCPFCKRWNENTKPLIELNYINTGKANMVFVDLAIIGPDSKDVHAGSYCAEEQGLYWEYHDYIYANQGHENDGWAKAENIKKLMPGLEGIDTKSFDECIDSKKYEGRVNENYIEASRTGANSTPSFLIMGPNDISAIQGAQPYDVFAKAIEEQLKG